MSWGAAIWPVWLPGKEMPLFWLLGGYLAYFPRYERKMTAGNVPAPFFQSWFSVVFDAIKFGPKERARLDADTLSNTSFDFAYSFQGSIGIVLTMANERLLIGDTTLDQSFEAIQQMAKSADTVQIATFAKKYGIASVRKMYAWANDLALAGMGADIKWRRGQSIRSNLFIQSEELELLTTAIASTSEEQETMSEFTGRLVGLDVTSRRFHMETEDHGDIKGAIAPAIGTQHTLEIPKVYTIVAQVKRKIYYATEKEDVSFYLLDVK
jgi:hypothetical protein